MKRTVTERGITLVELLVGVLAAAILVGGAMHFYVAEYGAAISQSQISDMQQNVRAAIDELTVKLRNAGANLPGNMPVLLTANTDPDILSVRFAPNSGSIPVGWGTTEKSSDPIEIDIARDISAFSVNQNVYIWYSDKSQGEWFIITSIVSKPGIGRHEIYHGGTNLLFAPMPGHFLVAMQDILYYIDASDTLHPTLMRRENSDPPEIFADNIEDLQFRYILSDGDTVETLTANDTVYLVRVAITAHTDAPDAQIAGNGVDPFRRRSLETGVLIRNNRF